MSNTFFQEGAKNLPGGIRTPGAPLVTRLVMNNRVSSHFRVFSEHIAPLCCKQTEFFFMRDCTIL